MSQKKPGWKRRSGPIAVLLGALSGGIPLFWNLEKWIGLAGLPEDAKSLYLWSNDFINVVPSHVYWMTLGMVIALGAAASVIYALEHWVYIWSKILVPYWAWRYVRITAIGKVPVHYRFVIREGPRTRQSPSVRRMKKGGNTNIRFDIPRNVYRFHLVIEVPPIFKLLFPSSRSDGEWIETIASSGRRRYKSAFGESRDKDSIWVQIVVVNRFGESGWGDVRARLKENWSLRSLAHLGRAVGMVVPAPPTFDELLASAQEQQARREDGVAPNPSHSD